jgi:hypothetical protein
MKKWTALLQCSSLKISRTFFPLFTCSHGFCNVEGPGVVDRHKQRGDKETECGRRCETEEYGDRLVQPQKKERKKGEAAEATQRRGSHR